MKRADRLYALMTRLRDGSLHRAEDLATALGVSVRTIYRDMDTLAASGVPVAGARGAGYTAHASITLPPLNLTQTELEALHLGLAAVGAGTLPDLASAAAALSAKIDAVLPEDAGAAPGRFGFATYPFAEAAQGFRHMPAFRAAIRARQKLRIALIGEAAAHAVRPLHIDYWGRIWTGIVWDEDTGDFASLRIDRIAELSPLPGLFVDEPGKRLADYQAR
ncbi:YafY family protein [Puniceibacterium sp. IMCC21224]|uniref:helix-turn-helix transcriptional regulator n=1 Tax=Puniceibacterium sp. IMCC21224 TaxID=1618204 RepID=UPI00064D9043|nr:HTH domain-containing protein [Puniceibacterium sp. IMCC21224]KMK66925.1 HTH domain-containing protein [Puniceibacterium sp. IMCC21224]